jgi:hypothetical protein
MLNNNQQIWDLLEKQDISKVYISYSTKRKKVEDQISIIIQDVTIVCKHANHSIFHDEIFKEDSFLRMPIFNSHKEVIGKSDGLLTYDNIKKKIILKGKYNKKIIEEYKIELDEKHECFKANIDND